MRKHHNKLFYGKYTHKATFNWPWCGFLYPTTNEHLKDIMYSEEFFNNHYFSDNIIKLKKYKEDIRRLALFILTHKNNIKFRLQTPMGIIYGPQKIVKEFILNFWNDWDNLITVEKKFSKVLEKDTVICNRLPHKKYQYQIRLKKDSYKKINDKKRYNLYQYLSQNKDVSLIAGRGLKKWLSGEKNSYPEGYFYITEEKYLTPIYMTIQDQIDKVIKFVKI